MAVEYNFFDLANRIVEQHAEVEKEVQRLTGQINEQKEILRRLERAMNALMPDEKKPAKKKTNSHGTNYGQKHATQILDFITNDTTQEDWSASQLKVALSLPQSSVNAALKYLRDNQLIRATRKIQGGGSAYATWE